MSVSVRTVTTAAFSVVAAVLLAIVFAQVSRAAGSAYLSVDKTTLTYDGTAGTTSNLKVSYASFAYVLEETAGSSAAPLTAGSGCTQVTAYKKISCPTVESTALFLNMGDGTDSLTMGSTALIPAHVLSTVTDVGTVTSSDGPMEIHNTDGGSVNGGNGYDNIFIYDANPTNGSGATPNVNAGAADDQITIENDTITPGGTEFSYGVSGGPGNDLIDASASTANFLYSSSSGTDVVLGSSGSDEFIIGDDRDLVFGNAGNDRFYDTAAYDTAEANLSEVWGGAGDDVFTDMYPKRMDVTHYEGGPGKDKVTYRTAHSDGWDPDIAISLDEPADDGVVGFGGASEGDHYHVSVEEIGGYNELTSTMQLGGDDTLVGSARANRIDGEDGNDSIYGEAGNDELLGGEGADYSYGGDGADVIDESTADYSSDALFGDAGNDLFKSAADGDSMFGGAGEDRVSYATASAVVIDLDTATWSPEYMESIENATGSPDADTIYGNASANKVDGADGDDTFDMTGGGVDEITCGAGTDTVDADTTDVIVDPLLCEAVTLH